MESTPGPYTAGNVARTKCSNFSGKRVRCIGRSNETVTTLSERNAVTPSASGDVPAGRIGENGTDGGAAGGVVLATGTEGRAVPPGAPACCALDRPESVVTVVTGAALAPLEFAAAVDSACFAALRPRSAVAPTALAARPVATTIAAAVPRSISFFRFICAASRASRRQCRHTVVPIPRSWVHSCIGPCGVCDKVWLRTRLANKVTSYDIGRNGPIASRSARNTRRLGRRANISSDGTLLDTILR